MTSIITINANIEYYAKYSNANIILFIILLNIIHRLKLTNSKEIHSKLKGNGIIELLRNLYNFFIVIAGWKKNDHEV